MINYARTDKSSPCAGNSLRGRIRGKESPRGRAAYHKNTPKIIFSNYRELVKPVDAVKWFGIEPEVPENVIQAPMASAAVGQ